MGLEKKGCTPMSGLADCAPGHSLTHRELSQGLNLIIGQESERSDSGLKLGVRPQPSDTGVSTSPSQPKTAVSHSVAAGVR